MSILDKCDSKMITDDYKKELGRICINFQALEVHICFFTWSLIGEDQVVGQIEQMNPVVSAMPFVMTQVMLRSASGVTGGILRGIDPERATDAMRIFKSFDHLDQKLTYRGQDPDKDDKPPGIILGKELAY